jgi:hypothetical protein
MSTEPTRGVRAKVCVADYNGDGLPDLLVGDFTNQKRLPLLELRMDEIRVPDVPPVLRESAEISEKVVTNLAVVCDQCSSQWGQRPACVTACPHDAAMRVDARIDFPGT